MEHRTNRCYLCGASADGAMEHVPPEVIFRGASGRSFKTPEIVTVPSCIEHNAGFSADDEVLAWVMCGLPNKNEAAWAVYMHLMAPVNERVMNDSAFSDDRLAHHGVRLLRDPSDYDEDGKPKSITIDHSYITRAEDELRTRWKTIKRAIQKVAAGLFYYHSKGECLGLRAVEQLSVMVPKFKQIEPEVILVSREFDKEGLLDEAFSKNNRPQWAQIESGDPMAFLCEIARHHRSKRFVMRMEFYREIDVWVLSR